MTITAAEIINLTRDQHGSLSQASSPDVLLLRRLGVEQRALYDLIFARVPGLLSQVLVVSLPLADFDAGIDLTMEIPGGWKDLTPRAELRFSSTPAPRNTVEVASVPWEQRLQPRSLPAYTFRNNVIYLLGAPQQYSQFAEFRLSYTPIPADMVDEDSVLVVPDDARDALVAMLATWALRRLVGNPMYGVSMAVWREYDNDAQITRSTFLRRIFQGIAQRQNYEINVVT